MGKLTSIDKKRNVLLSGRNAATAVSRIPVLQLHRRSLKGFTACIAGIMHHSHLSKSLHLLDVFIFCFEPQHCLLALFAAAKATFCTRFDSSCVSQVRPSFGDFWNHVFDSCELISGWSRWSAASTTIVERQRCPFLLLQMAMGADLTTTAHSTGKSFYIWSPKGWFTICAELERSVTRRQRAAQSVLAPLRCDNLQYTRWCLQYSASQSGTERICASASYQFTIYALGRQHQPLQNRINF